MTIEQSNRIAKVAAVVAGLGLVAMTFASYNPPHGEITATSTEAVQ